MNKDKHTKNISEYDKRQEGSRRIGKIAKGAAIVALTASVGYAAVERMNENADTGIPSSELLRSIKNGDTTVEEAGLEIYTVRPGDTLHGIAEEMYGDEKNKVNVAHDMLEQIREMNDDPTLDAGSISPGERIYYHPLEDEK